MGNFNKIQTNIFDDRLYFLNDKLHREDGPAIEYSNGENEWHLNDEFLFNDLQLKEHGLSNPYSLKDIQRTKFLLDNISIIPKERYHDYEYIDSVRILD